LCFLRNKHSPTLPNPSLKQNQLSRSRETIMEGIKKAFATCKAEGRVGFPFLRNIPNKNFQSQPLTAVKTDCFDPLCYCWVSDSWGNRRSHAGNGGWRCWYY